MSVLPFFIDCTDCPCLIIGGSEEAVTLAHRLLQAGARVTVWSVEMSGQFTDLQKQAVERLSLVRGDMTTELLTYLLSSQNKPRFLFLQSDLIQPEWIEMIQSSGVFWNAIGRKSEFTLGTIVDRGDLQFGVSDGAAPELESIWTKRLERELPKDWREGSVAYTAYRRSEALQSRHPELRSYELAEMASALMECNGRFEAAKALAQKREERKL